MPEDKLSDDLARVVTDEGAAAFAAGIPATAIPYHSAGDERFLWLKGWMDAAAEGRCQTI